MCHQYARIMSFLLLCTAFVCSMEKNETLQEQAVEYSRIWSFIGLVIVTLGLMLAASGGIGGGGILVPIFIIFWHFPTKTAIPLSNVTIFGGALANFMLNVAKKHPEERRSLIDYDVVLMMEPTTMGGSIVGAILNKLLPEWVISILLIALLTFTLYRTWMKYIRLSALEENVHQSAFEMKLYRSSSSLPMIMHDSDMCEDDADMVLQAMDGKERRALFESIEKDLAKGTHSAYGSFSGTKKLREQLELYDIMEQEAKFPYLKVLYLVFIEFGVMVFTLIKGVQNGYNPFHITCGSSGYIILLFAPIIWIMIHYVIIRKYLLHCHYKKLYLGYQYLSSDVRWNSRNTLLYPFICTFAGICAGCFGIGGGIIKGPLMLEMGILPQVASASSAFMILFTTLSASVVYIAFGQLVMEYALPLCVLGFVSTFIGHAAVSVYISSSKKSSIIVLLIAVVLFLSILLMGYQSVAASFAPSVTYHPHLC